MNNITLVFFGENVFSTVVLNSLIDLNYHIPLVVTPYYETDAYKSIEQTAKLNNIEYRREKDINNPIVVQKVREISPDLIISADFSRIIRKDLLTIPRLGCINLHPSLLPFYRGLAPQHFPIINGETETGVTVHFIDEGIDTGNIIIQKMIDINENTYVADVLLAWRKIYQTIMPEAIALVINGEKGIKQNAEEGSYYGRLKPIQCEILMEKGVRSAYNLVRGVSTPYCGAFLRCKENQISKEQNILRIWEAKIENEGIQLMIKTIAIDGDDLLVPFCDGVLRVSDYEWENEQKINI
jgi:methionyl-tRNA formyltransferase